MYCTKCGNKIEDGALFCSVCGSKMEPDSSDIFYQKSRYDEPREEQSPYSKTSLILAILSVLSTLATFLGFYFGFLIGISLGIASLQYVRRDRITSGRYNITAKTLAILGVGLAVLMILAGVLYIVVYGYEDI